VLTPAVMTILGELLEQRPAERFSLSAALAELVQRERYLALRITDRRVDLGARYGPFIAQLSLAMTGRDKTELLSQIVEALTLREEADAGPGR
jgi:UTP-glucose-1-phosphate uridylyltransferase